MDWWLVNPWDLLSAEVIFGMLWASGALAIIGGAGFFALFVSWRLFWFMTLVFQGGRGGSRYNDSWKVGQYRGGRR